MRRNALLPVLLWISVGATTGPVNAQTSPSTPARFSAAPDPNAADDSPDWLFPVARLDEIVPGWLRIGGEYHNRLERPTGIGYARTRDFYLLDRLRVHATIRPKPWQLSR